MAINIFSNLTGMVVSESGIFYHVEGIVHSFSPNPRNIFKDGIEAPVGWGDGVRHYEKAIKTLIIPEGVKGFADHFMMGWAITESVVLPDSLVSIGKEDGEGCVFGKCYLPEIILPQGIKCLGPYAFGNCYIKKLTVPATIRSKYNRQFKDSTIEQLYLPKVILESPELSIEGDAYGFYRNFFIHCHCHIVPY